MNKSSLPRQCAAAGILLGAPLAVLAQDGPNSSIYSGRLNQQRVALRRQEAQAAPSYGPPVPPVSGWYEMRQVRLALATGEAIAEYPADTPYPSVLVLAIGTGTGLTATYFDNADFTGFSVTRLEPVMTAALVWGWRSVVRLHAQLGATCAWWSSTTV